MPEETGKPLLTAGQMCPLLYVAWFALVRPRTFRVRLCVAYNKGAHFFGRCSPDNAAIFPCCFSLISMTRNTSLLIANFILLHIGLHPFHAFA